MAIYSLREPAPFRQDHNPTCTVRSITVPPARLWTKCRSRAKKTFKYRKHDPEKRIAYLRELRWITTGRGSADWVDIDASGFEPESYRRHGWSPRGHPVYGNCRATSGLAKVWLLRGVARIFWLRCCSPAPPTPIGWMI